MNNNFADMQDDNTEDEEDISTEEIQSGDGLTTGQADAVSGGKALRAGYSDASIHHHKDQPLRFDRRMLRELGLIASGALLFSLSMNVLIVPAGMYNGGFLGIAQLLRIFAMNTLPLEGFHGDLSGYIYFLLNVPLLLVCLHHFGRRFFVKTIFCVVCYSAFLALIPIPSVPVLDEEIALCLLGGIACGTGAAITLTAGCSGGGEEIIGLLLSQRWSGFSVGKFSIMLNVLVFGIGFACFNYQLVIYSIIFSCITYLVLDRMHLQNIMMTMIIISKVPGMEQAVFDLVHRGVTTWDGSGGYSQTPSHVLLTVVSKKEANLLRERLPELDENVFIILNEDVAVTGNFKKRI